MLIESHNNLLVDVNKYWIKSKTLVSHVTLKKTQFREVLLTDWQDKSKTPCEHQTSTLHNRQHAQLSEINIQLKCRVPLEFTKLGIMELKSNPYYLAIFNWDAWFHCIQTFVISNLNSCYLSNLINTTSLRKFRFKIHTFVSVR